MGKWIFYPKSEASSTKAKIQWCDEAGKGTSDGLGAVKLNQITKDPGANIATPDPGGWLD